MSRNSALRALGLGNGSLRTAPNRIGTGLSLRPFSSTTQRNATIPHFTPTASPDLDNLLEDLRTKIVMPRLLPEHQRKKLTTLKWAKRLQSDPITIEVDGEVFKFGYRDPMTELPSTRLAMAEAAKEFHKIDDFSNMRPLLEGIKITGQPHGADLYNKLIRLACNKGHVHEVIECARMVSRTGLKMDNSEAVNQTLHWTLRKALDAEFDPAETAQALRWAEMVLDLLQSEAHQPKKGTTVQPVEGQLPLDRDPMVLMAPLHLAAALVRVSEDDTEKKAALAKTISLARDVVTVWPEGKRLKETQPAEAYEVKFGLRYLKNLNTYVFFTAPLLSGLEKASEAIEAAGVEPELVTQLLSRSEVLAGEIAEARQSLNNRQAGEESYQRFHAV